MFIAFFEIRWADVSQEHHIVITGFMPVIHKSVDGIKLDYRDKPGNDGG